MKRIARRIAASLLSFSMLFNSGMPTFIIADDILNDETEEAADGQEEAPAEETPAEGESQPEETDSEEIPQESEETGQAEESDSEPEPEETPDEQDDPADEQPEISAYSVVAVYQSDDGIYEERELTLGSEPVSAAELAETIEGYTWNESATITKSDGSTDIFTAIADTYYVTADADGNEYTVNFADVFAEGETVYAVFDYSAEVFEESEEDAELMGDGDGYAHPDYHEDLGDLTKEAVVEGVTDGKVYEGQKYDVVVKFQEIPGVEDYGGDQFYTDRSLSYHLPDGFNADPTTDTVDVTIREGGTSYTIHGSTYTVDENGNVSFTWNTSDPNWNKVADSANVELDLEFTGEFTSSHLEWGNHVTTDLQLVSDSNVTIEKTSNGYDANNNEIWYTVKVKSEGHSTNVNIQDALKPGSALTIDPSSFTITGTTVTPTVSGTGFGMTVPEMNNGEEITITYKATVDTSKLTGKGTVEQTGNDVRVTSTEDPEGDTKSKDFENQISYMTSSKSAGEVTGSGNERRVPYTVTINNGNNKYPMGGHSITDTIDPGSASIMTYDPEGSITIQVTDPATGQVVRTDTIKFTDLPVHEDNTWKYTFPEGDTVPYVYTITYETIVDMTGQMKEVTVKNKVEPDNGNASEATVGVGPDEGARVGVTKEATSVSYDSISWKVTLHVPEAGLNSAVVNETYPSTWVNGTQYFEKPDPQTKDAFTVTGLDSDEDFTVDWQNDKAVLTFTKGGAPGLNGTETEGGRDIVITFTTKNNQTWLDTWPRTPHQNNVTFTGNGTPVSDNASGTPVKAEVQKTRGNQDATAPDGMKAYMYDVRISGVTDTNVQITDVFGQDTDGDGVIDFVPFEIYKPDACYNQEYYIAGGDNEAYQGETVSGGTQISYSDDGNGTATFDLSGASWPKKSDGSFYNYYRIRYYLKVKDQAALDRLNALAASKPGGVYSAVNTASWSGGSDDASVDFKYTSVKKETLVNGVPTDSQTVDLTADNAVLSYRLTINEGAQDINPTGDTVELKDDFEGMAIDYQSISFEPSTGVTYNVRGNTLTATIPDNTKVVVTYTMRVNGTGNVHIKNTADINGQAAVSDKTAHTKAQSGGSVPSINVFKFQGDQMETKLEGAVFGLFHEDGKPVKGYDHERQESEPAPERDTDVIVKTDEDGMATFMGSEAKNGWTLVYNHRYYIQELTAPSGYALDPTKYYFTIADDGISHYDQRIYVDGDTLTVRNYKKTGIEITKTLAGLPEGVVPEITFTVTRTDETEDPIILTLANDFELTGDKYVLTADGLGKLDNLTPGATYQVVESVGTLEDATLKSTTYTITKGETTTDPQDGTTASGITLQEDETAVVDYTNTYETAKGNLKVTKTFAGNTGKLTDDDKKRISFTVSGPEWEEPQIFTYAQMENGEKTFEGIALGEYTVTETIAEGDKTFTTTYKVNSGDPQKGTATGPQELTENGLTIDFTNSYWETTAVLEAEKKVETADGVTAPEKNFTFTLNKQGDAPMPAEKTEITVAGGASDTFGEITFTEEGTFKYTITETETGTDGGWTYNVNGDVTATVTVTADPDTGELSAAVTYDKPNDDNDAGLITNKYEEGKLKVEKTVQLNGTTDTGAAGQTFTVGLFESDSDSQPVKTETITIGADGTGEVIFDGLTVGHTYFVYEMDGESKAGEKIGEYTVVTGSGSAEAAPASTDDSKLEAVELVNNKKTGDLKVEKVISGTGASAADVFTFDITIADAAGKTYSASGAVNSVTFDASGKATVELKGGESVTITGLPDGASYTVSEQEENKNGYSTVKENASGTISADSTATVTAKFTNTKNSGGLTITKTFAGNTDKLTDEDKNRISFTVSGPEWEDPQTFTYADMTNGVMTYDGIALGEYTVTETIAGGDKTFTTTYTVNSGDKQEGTTTGPQELTENGLTIAFTNTYQETSAVLKIEKKIDAADGVTIPEKDFTFTLSAQGDVPMPETEDGKTVTVTGANSGSFGEIVFTKAGDFKYTITEDASEEDPGWTYNTEGNVTATVHVTEDKDTGKLSASVEYSPENTRKDAGLITNSYEDGKLKVVKTAKLNGTEDPDAAGQKFTVGLFDSETAETPLETKEITIGSDGTGSVLFEHLETGKIYYVFEMDGSKKAGEKIGEYTVVTGSGSAEAVITSTEDDQLEPVELENDKKTGDLTVTKVVDGEGAPEGDEFTFDITVAGTAGKTYEAEGKVTEAAFDASNKTTVTLKNGESVTIKGLPDGAEYTVTEQEANQRGYTTKAENASGTISADSTAAVTVTFTNTHQQGSAEIKVEKVIETQDGVTAPEKEFTFKLTPVDGAPMPEEGADEVTITGAGEGTFREIVYTEAGTYKYTISEIGAENKDGWTCNINGDITATVTVTKDAESGTISAVVSYDNKTDGKITNKYEQPEVSVKVPVKKTVTGNDYDGDADFTFTIESVSAVDADGKDITELPEIESPTAVVKKNETGEFTILGYTVPGTYTYTVKEQAGDEEGMVYDETEYTVVVTVTASADGNTLNAEVETEDGTKITADKPLVITNKYQKTSAVLKIEKKIEAADGVTVPEKEFTFTLEASGEAPMPEEEGGDTVTVTGAKSGSFGEIVFTKAGDFEYTITEDDSEAEGGWTYNINEDVTAIVHVTEDETTGKLSASVEYDPANDAKDAGLITNKYEEGKIKVVKEAQHNGETDPDASGKTFKVGIFESEDAETPLETKEIKIGSDGTGSVIFDGLKVGETYYVYEMDGDEKAGEKIGEYTVVTGDGSAEAVVESTDDEELTAVELVNDRETGNLEVTKKTEGAPESEADKKFKIAVHDDALIYYKQDGTPNGEDPVWVEIKAGETATWENLPAGMYTVEEDPDSAKISGYTLTADCGGEVDVKAGEDASAEVTNTYTQEVGSLILKKKLADGAPDEAKSKAYRFTVKVKDSNPAKYVQEDGSVSTTAYEFSVTAGKEVKIENVPVGEYVVEEVESSAVIDGYTVEISKAVNVKVEKDGEAEAEITNTYTQEEGDLKVSKTVKSDSKNDKKTEFKFKVTLDDKTISGTFGDMTFKNGVAEFTLKDGESKTAKGLPAGVKYTVEEEKADGFTVTKTGDTGTIKANKTAEAKFTNTKTSPKDKTTKIKVKKVWKDGNNVNGTRPDSIRVHLLADGVDTGKDAVLSPANNWSYTWTGLPVYNADGSIINYTVVEDTVPGYTAEYSGSMSSGFTITNKKPTVPNTADNFDALRLQAALLLSMIGALLSAFLLRRTAD